MSSYHSVLPVDLSRAFGGGSGLHFACLADATRVSQERRGTGSGSTEAGVSVKVVAAETGVSPFGLSVLSWFTKRRLLKEGTWRSRA